MPERLALCDLGAPGWGEPWFLHSAVLLYFFGVAMCVMLVWSLCFLFLRHTQFELIQCYHLSSIWRCWTGWPIDHSPSLLVFFGLLFAFVSLVVLCWCFPCFLVWFWDCDGSLDYVSVLASSTVETVIELPTSLQELVNSLVATCNRTCWTTWRKPRGVGRKKKIDKACLRGFWGGYRCVQ